ncbi:unnamed protein product [Allacma fusca]|uniref:C2H2-type domain-containing protein n=1 Tax=Allacma fusca TaxID=39272 RepID=A0A8J2NJ15_9HEXA|nr:unnamed protein product [Allacma fusca]
MSSLEDLPQDFVPNSKKPKKIKKFKIKNLKLLKLQLVEEDEDDYETISTKDVMLGEAIDKDLDFEGWPNDSESEGESEADESESYISEDEVHADNIIDDLDLNQDESLSHKTFKERAMELMKKTQGEHSNLVQRVLNAEDWLFIHRIIRKSKGLKSKFMIRNLNPFLFDSKHVISWKCKFCKDMVPAPVKNYTEHLASHGIGADEDPTLPCDVCGEYVKKDKYVVHWVPHFMEHECPICKKTFALNCHMRYHYKVVHEEGEQTCFQCGKLMKNDLAMRRHLRLFHSNRTAWKICDICGKCVKARCLEPHKLTHSQDRPYKCDICKKCFKTPSTLYQHQKVHATDSKAHKYLCEYCGKRFKHHTSWNLHVVRIHEGEYEHECPVCHKRFHKLFELKKHSVKHSEDRPFPCSVCGKHFKTKTHLKEHVTIHSESKSHVCPLCGKGIRMKANLYKHLKVHRNRGEYVPPLNGNSTNSLFNSYGLSSSSNSISNNSSSTFVNSNQKSSNESTAGENTISNKSTSVNTPLPNSSNIMQQLVPGTSELTQSVQISMPIDTTQTFISTAETSPTEEVDYNLRLTLSNNDLLKDSTMLIDTTSDSDQIQEIGTQSQILVLDSNNTSAITNIQGSEDGKGFQKYDTDLILTTAPDGTVLGQHNPNNQLEIPTSLSAFDGIIPSTNNLQNDLTGATLNNFSNNILALFTSQNDTLRLNGGTVTHLTILVNHNGLGGMTITPLQTE